MQILFGPEHDGLHIDPSEPNGYEWWYFDAISDDERYVLVVIFFLGTPMSPYYKAVVDGKNPLPKDWCGVFVSLHERTKNGYKERAYAYNLYTENWENLLKTGTPDGLNYFRDKPLHIELGDSTVNGTYSHNGRRFTHSWLIELNERNLWFGATKANLTFTSSFLLDGKPTIESKYEGHNWVCVAPDCKVTGNVSFAGKTVQFFGRGYHDHNFGRLPWGNMQEWFWGRVRFPDDSPISGAVFYALWEGDEQEIFDATGAFVAVWSDSQSFRFTTSAQISLVGHKRDSPLVPYEVTADEILSQPITAWGNGFLQRGPFYRRLNLGASIGGDDKSCGSGVAEVFRPARLCGPIISRMMWTRIRRRS